MTVHHTDDLTMKPYAEIIAALIVSAAFAFWIWCAYY